MAVLWVRLKGQRTFSADQKPTLKAKRVYLVKCDDKNDGADIAAEAVGVSIGASYSDRYPGVLARSIAADEGERTADGGVLYEVTVDYSNQSDNQNGGDKEADDPDPTHRPGILRLSLCPFDQPHLTAGWLTRHDAAHGSEGESNGGALA